MIWIDHGKGVSTAANQFGTCTVREVSPIDYAWQMVTTGGDVQEGYAVSLVVARRRAENALMPGRKSSAKFSAMRRTMVRDVGTSEPFFYER